MHGCSYFQELDMWLLYLRFDTQGAVKTYHVRVPNKGLMLDLVNRCEQHGLQLDEKLVEYAAFITSGTIKLKPMIAPNFHFYDYPDFLERWQQIHKFSRHGDCRL
jgi:hypothetical protein